MMMVMKDPRLVSPTSRSMAEEMVRNSSCLSHTSQNHKLHRTEEVEDKKNHRTSRSVWSSSHIPRRRRAVIHRMTLRWILVMVVCWCCMIQPSASSSSRSSASFSSTSRLSPAVSSSSLTTSTREAADESSLSMTSAADSTSVQSSNVVIQLASYIKNSIVKTVDGCGQLWSNYGRCNDIRKKIDVYRHQIQLEWEEETGSLSSQQKSRLKSLVGGISYEEFVHLQKGKDDRSKVMNLMFLMWGAPRFLPYALMFNSDMLPSPFRETSSSTTGESIWTTQSRDRSSAVIRALLKLEHEARVTPALAKLNVFGKKQQEQTKQQLLQSIDTISDLLASSIPSRFKGATRLLQQYESHWYRGGRSDAHEETDATTSTTAAATPFTRAELRLCSIPKPLVVCIDMIMSGGGSGGGFLSGLQPHFMTRGRVVGQLRKVTESDDFLLQTQLNLTTISKRYLQEACSERQMSVLGLSTDDLRNQLHEWLQSCSYRPQQQQQQQQPESTTAPSSIVPIASDPYYNGNVVRLILMGYYSCWATRESQSALKLPRLLYAHSHPTGSSSTLSTKAATHAPSSSSSHSSVTPSSPERSGSSIDDHDHVRNPLRRFMKR